MHLGFDTSLDRVESGSPCFTGSLLDGADFVVCHWTPRGDVESEIERAASVCAAFDRAGRDFIINCEYVNWSDTLVTPDGWDWCNTTDGCHRMNIPAALTAAYAGDRHFLGFMYDEMEHGIINRNLSITMSRTGRKNLPVFPLGAQKTARAADELLRRQLSDYASSFTGAGAKYLAGEHVFPVLFHDFAAAGITPDFKSQKESCSAIQFATAAGAALEYGTELWNCVDLWYRLKFPGHSPEEMYHNLVFAFLTGVDRVYVESSSAFYGEGNEPTAWGTEFGRFAREYGGVKRPYSIRSYRPEIGIVRMDDTYWGQCDPFAWKPILYGDPGIRIAPESREWTKAWHVITHGMSGRNGLSWDRVSPWSLRAHRSFLPMNSPVVFDERVGADQLTSLRLLFLCGSCISEGTLSAAAALVRDKGLTVVTSPRFAPESVRARVRGGFARVKDGAGEWIITGDMASGRVKEAVAPMLGRSDEMTFRFDEGAVACAYP